VKSNLIRNSSKLSLGYIFIPSHIIELLVYDIVRNVYETSTSSVLNHVSKEKEKFSKDACAFL